VSEAMSGQQVIDRITDLAAGGIGIMDLLVNAMYEPGQYVKRENLSTSAITATPEGGRVFYVETTTPNTDLEIFKVTITPA